MNQIKEFLKESSLSRVWKHAQSDRLIAIFSGFRNENTHKQNIKNNKDIASTLRSNGFGYFFVDGYWIENEGTPDEVHVEEDSIFAIAEKEDEQKFIKLVVSLGKKYNQDGVLVKKSDGKYYILDKNGKETLKLNTLNAGKIGSLYTKLRNNKKSNTFVVESERDDAGFIGHYKK